MKLRDGFVQPPEVPDVLVAVFLAAEVVGGEGGEEGVAEEGVDEAVERGGDDEAVEKES